MKPSSLSAAIEARRRWLAVCMAVMLATLAGCASVSSAFDALITPTQRPITPVWQNLVISASPDANLNSPIAVDILFISTPDLLKNFQDLNAIKWFTGRENAMRSFPEGLRLISLELVPGQTITVTKTDLAKISALQAFVFANYATAGDHKQTLAMDESGYVIKLEGRAFKVNAVSGNKKP